MADSSGVLFGVDVSHHQDTMDVGLLPVDFVIARTAQVKGGKYATSTYDRRYQAHKANASAGGKLFSSYLYLGSGMSAEGNVAVHRSVEPDINVPVMLDWEDGSGDGNFLKACYGAFTDAGYYVWGVYVPSWYWKEQGSPDLSGLPPLIASRYADMKPGSLASEYASTPESYWLGYGNNTPRMVQFTSSLRLPPYPANNLDGDAFKGTRADLANWWNPSTPLPENTTGESDVSLIQTIRVPASPTTTGIQIPRLPGGANCKLIVRVPGFDWTTRKTTTPVWQGHVFAYGDRNSGVGHDPAYLPNFKSKLDADAEILLPGALNARYEYSCAVDFDLEIYG